MESSSAPRLACVDLPAFPLQLLLRRHPPWKSLPAAVVSEDRPQGKILWVNERARQRRVLPGHRYAHGLALAPSLRAGEVSSVEIEQGMKEVAGILAQYSPGVDPCSGEPGVFWLDASGMGKLYRSLGCWGRAIQRRLHQAALDSTLAIGFSRFATYALARSHRQGVTVFCDRDQERQHARRVPLERLDLEPVLRDALAKLGITTLGAFLRLPPAGVLQRFGSEAYRLHRLAAGEQWDPLQPQLVPEPLEQRFFCDQPEVDIERLVFTIKRALHPLLARLAAGRAALATLFVQLTLDRIREPSLDVIRPAEPTLDARTLLRLVHLRLESRPPRAGVVEVVLSAEDVAATQEQLDLFARKPRRSLSAAQEAFARLRARFGNEAVVKAVLREGHLPEAQYAWEVLDRAVLPEPRPATTARPLVRRIHAQPVMLPPQNALVRDDGWLLRGLEHGPVVRVVGPYILSGGWWNSEIHREYHFAETKRGELLWVYYDRRRRRWFLHGHIE